ncbi:MipA/OmpV family protein [Alteromonas gilva]|uniref:MipA/OmpV family protein n=1 Tax=Alteromonas gilva TaxID=2987522 RepID=A0ABT5L605_9ALTE|nr:MipA/OmpV family protein [Alteromonas gilva]MDC8832490.1 MipA/OmpV family protein [Alteromonas gilva]
MKSIFSARHALVTGICIVVSAALASPAIAQERNQQTNSPNRDLTGFEALNEALPLWEFGVGGGVGEVPNYPASSERNFIALAAPYVIYRGDVLRVGGGGGARAVMLDNNDIEIDISVGGAFAADSDDGTVREGMPELDYLFEIGPQLVYRVKDYNFDGGGNARLNFRLQARAVFSTDFSRIDDRGFVLEPQLAYQQRGTLFPDTALNASFSVVFASEKLQDYFYQVDEAFVTPDRDLFNAQAGFLGAEANLSIAFPIRKNIRGFVGGTMRFHGGAANEESPLFEDDITYSIGAGFVWRLYQSEQRASW